MIPEFLQDNLIKEIQDIFQGQTFKVPGTDERRELNVYKQEIPFLDAIDTEQYTEEQLENGLVDEETLNNAFPYVLVCVSGGTVPMYDQSISSSVNCDLVIGVFDDEHNKQGYRDAMHIINGIVERFAKNPILAKHYVIEEGVEWGLQNYDSDTYPYYFGAVSLPFSIPAPKMESDLI